MRRCRRAASFSERRLPPPALNDREHGKNHLSAEADRSGGRFESGKLIHERSTEHSTESDLSRHQHHECLHAYDLKQTGYHDFRPLAVLVRDPQTGKVIGGLHGRSEFGLVYVAWFFLPEDLRRARIGSRVLAMAEEEGRRRGCTRIALTTLSIEAPGARELARTMSAQPLPASSGLAASNSATGNSTLPRRRRRCSAPRCDSGIKSRPGRRR